ncbi:hypothetical protein B0H11DRAFT_2201039 [Mycena galericulata]|nr:hypothetical protein B0H11DRAFT_2201039 [Mycena galericulata]
MEEGHNLEELEGDMEASTLCGSPMAIWSSQQKRTCSASILAAQSSVFHDMFACPQPEDGEAEILGGSPVVPLPDAAAELEVYFMPVSVDFDAVLGILRLAHKYGVQYLHVRAFQQLAVQGWGNMLPLWSAGHSRIGRGSGGRHLRAMRITVLGANSPLVRIVPPWLATQDVRLAASAESLVLVLSATSSPVGDSEFLCTNSPQI